MADPTVVTGILDRLLARTGEMHDGERVEWWPILELSIAFPAAVWVPVDRDGARIFEIDTVPIAPAELEVLTRRGDEPLAGTAKSNFELAVAARTATVALAGALATEWDDAGGGELTNLQVELFDHVNRAITGIDKVCDHFYRDDTGG